jgi:DNA-binding NarL/FixJ family response regulator
VPGESAPSFLEQGRARFAERAWADARQAFAAAEREAPLEAEDQERAAWCAWLLACDDELFTALERAYTLYLAAGNDERGALCAFWLGSRLMFQGEVGRGGGWLARLAEIAQRSHEESVVHGYLLLTAANKHIFANELQQAAGVITRAAAVAKRTGDLDLEALTQSALGRILVRKGEIERGLSLLDLSMLTASAESVKPNVTGIVYCAAIGNCNRIFALDRAREWTQQLARFCDAQPQMISFSGTCLVHCSEVHQACGDWPAALREAERACERIPATGAPNSGALADGLYQRAELKRLYGEFDAAEQLYRAANQAGREPQPGLSLLRVAQGRPDQAAVAMRRVLAAKPEPQDRLAFLPASVEVFLAAEQLSEARAVVEELQDALEPQASDVLRAIAAHARGSLLLAEDAPQAALSPLRSSFEIWRRLGAPYLAARVRVELAQACRALADLDGAELELAAARAVFERLGARHDLAKLVAAPARTGAAGLTPRELEVLRLVASGKTNKAIASELHLSEKTVDRHVSNIFVKLNVASRAAATAYAYQHQLF